MTIDEMIGEISFRLPDEYPEWSEIARLARLGAAVEAMPVRYALVHQNPSWGGEGPWECGEQLNYEAGVNHRGDPCYTPQDALNTLLQSMGDSDK